MYLIRDRKLAPTSLTVAVAALQFLDTVTLGRDCVLSTEIPAPKRPHTLPVVLSPDEVVQFLGCVKIPLHHTILTTCYAAGLRISEAIRLTVPAIDSRRMVLRVEQGKGQKDRYVMLSPKLLELLRAWWRRERPPHWLFPSDRPDGHISDVAVQRECQRAHRRSRLRKPVTPHAVRSVSA